MLRTLVRNVAISGVAFFLISVVGLLLVPVLIQHYGIAGFGYISLARLFLPTTALGMFDFGFGESATQAVARARTDLDWRRCGRVLKLVAVLAASTGMVIGIALVAVSPWLGQWLGLAQQSIAFMHLIWSTAALMPILFMSLAFEGVIKGFERYVALRSLEVLTSLFYTFLVLAVVGFSFDVVFVCYALLATQALRTVVAAALSLKWLHSENVRQQKVQHEDIKQFKAVTRVMATNKLLGTMQSQLAPLLIGFFLGPAELGIYDVLSRLPRAAKAVLGLISTTVLPLASKLESEKDEVSLSRLGHAGILLVGIVTLPPLVATMVFSESLLRLWVGPELSRFYVWQAAMFIVPALSVLLSFGGTALLTRPAVVGAMNRLVLLQIVIQFALAWLTAGKFQECAFILGQVVAVAVTFVPQILLIINELGIPSRIYGQLVSLMSLLLALALIALWWVPPLGNWLTLIAAIGAWSFAAWVVIFFLVLPASYRNKFIKVLQQP